MPNHSEVVTQEKLQGFFTDCYKAHLIITEPKAALIRAQRDEEHYYFTVGEYAYNLYFDISKVNGDDINKIAKSFMVTNPKILVKTETGRYQGLADNNFFEVKISGVPDESAA